MVCCCTRYRISYQACRTGSCTRCKCTEANVQLQCRLHSVTLSLPLSSVCERRTTAARGLPSSNYRLRPPRQRPSTKQQTKLPAPHTAVVSERPRVTRAGCIGPPYRSMIDTPGGTHTGRLNIAHTQLETKFEFISNISEYSIFTSSITALDSPRRLASTTPSALTSRFISSTEILDCVRTF